MLTRQAARLSTKLPLQGAGLVVAFKKLAAAPASTAGQAGNLKQAPAQPSRRHQQSGQLPAEPQQVIATQMQAPWSLAPAGSDVLREEERQQVIPDSGYRYQQHQTGVGLHGYRTVEEKPVPPAPDTSHISVSPQSVKIYWLISRTEPPAPAAPELDLDDISLAHTPVPDMADPRDEIPVRSEPGYQRHH